MIYGAPISLMSLECT